MTHSPLTIGEALALACPFCRAEANTPCVSPGRGEVLAEPHYTRRVQPRPVALGEFHVGDGLFFCRQPNGDVVVTSRGTTLDPERRVLVTEGAWLSVLCQMSARGETSETLGEAREFHRLAYTGVSR